ncbi:MAG TPA: autotransporter-associated beta strand repeat-containing protein, partial [Methylomirabilota bacterium]|nr:autotransporter-associated beta strand repeat-containing protein [Methylomirabilota bacterium]
MTNSFEKSPVRFRLFVSMVYVVATPMLAMLCASTGQAETILIKANTATMNLAADWTPNGVPTNANIGKFDGAISSGNEGSLALGGNVTLAGLVFSNNLNGPVSIAASVNTLTLDSSMIAGGTGIDMSIANQNVTNNSPLTLKGFQAWNVISGKALTLGGALTHTGAGVDFSSFAGKLGTLANVNGILGPWATIGSGTSLKYATNNAGVAIGSYTGGTALPTTGGSATANYTLSTAQTETAAITGNTLQYTGNAQTLALGAAGTSTLTLNGLMNSGTGALTIGADGNTNIVIGGANNELVIAGNTNGITIFSAITNNPAGASSVTYNGLGTLTLGAGTTSGVNSTTENSSSFTGDFVINSGIVSVKKEVSLNSLGAGQNLTTSALGSPAVARNVIINNGAILSIDISNPFGPGATSKSNPGYPQFTIVVNNGGMFRTTTGNATIGPLVLNGGTVSITSPNKATFAPLGLENDVTVGGSSPSFITASAGGGFNLTVTNTQVRIFNVADATGDANVDLTVSAVMDDNTSPAGASSFIKAGVGTMLLAATNIYSGVTTISAGTLIAGTNSPSGAVGAFGNASSAIVLGDANTTANNSSPALLAGGAFTIGRAITVAAQPSTGTYTIGGYTDNNSTFSGLITINTNLTVSQAANAGANTLTISGGITGGNAGSKTITFAGPGNALIASTAISDGGGTVAVNVTGGKNTFAVPNTYSGSTTIISNVLALTGSGSISNSGSIGINAGGTFDVSGL